jgi:hypothetical protein
MTIVLSNLDFDLQKFLAGTIALRGVHGKKTPMCQPSLEAVANKADGFQNRFKIDIPTHWVFTRLTPATVNGLDSWKIQLTFLQHPLRRPLTKTGPPA